MFLGLMMKHQRVQIMPVQVRAKFCVKESFSAGRAKSEMPARTRAHYLACQYIASFRFEAGSADLHDGSPGTQQR